MSSEIVRSPHRKAEDVKLLFEQAQALADLLQDAVKLGYSIVLTPEQMKMVIAILKQARLAKDSNTGFAA